MSADRRQARILAMQALCQWDVQKDESQEALDAFLCDETPQGRVTRYARNLVLTFWTYRTETDERIEQASERWTLARMSPVERNVIRLALVEPLDGTVPPKVALNEAIEISKEFGGEDSPRFVNGVLDQVLNASPPETQDQT